MILPAAKEGRYRIETVIGKKMNIGDALVLFGRASFGMGTDPRNRRKKRICPSLMAWSIAAKFSLELIARQCFLPALKTNGHKLYGVWQVIIESSLDIGRMRQLAALMPTCAHALYSVPHNRWNKGNNKSGNKRGKPTMMWHPEALLRSFLDASIDAFVRRSVNRASDIMGIEASAQALSELERRQGSESINTLLRLRHNVDMVAKLAQADLQVIKALESQAASRDDNNEETTEAQDQLGEQPAEKPFVCESKEDAETKALRLAEEARYERDALIRSLMPQKEYVNTTYCELSELPRWESRWFDALIAPKEDSQMSYHLEDPDLVEAIKAWLLPVHEGSTTKDVDTKTGFWLETPKGDDKSQWYLRYMLVAREDANLTISASDVFSIGTEKLRLGQHCFDVPQEKLLKDLGTAGKFCESIKKSLDQQKPEGVYLDVKEAWTFISEVSPMLCSAGFDVRLPEQLVDQGSRHLRARLRIRDANTIEKSQFGLDGLARFEWEAALGDEIVSAEEFKQIVALKQPLVQWRGSWVLVDPVQLRDIENFIDQNQTTGTISQFEAMNRALTGEADPNNPGSKTEIVVEGKILDILQRLSQESIQDIVLKAPPAFVGTLRPYQERGAAWLSYQERLGLGCCLADDMGLGKTIQLIVHVLNHMQRHPNETRGFLFVCPMSVVGNWKREFKRFAPSLNVVVHHGSDRAQDIDELREQLKQPGTAVITTYGLITRGSEFLFEHKWAMVVLDEAQAIKNATSKRAMSVRELQADFRVALTGTPIENRLAELWSILDFLNPGLLGTSVRFNRTYAIPIERYNDERAIERLKTLVSPFILRRVKSDPSVIQDLPEKMEHKVYCTLTREQAKMYQELVDASMKKIDEAKGIARHGHVLALLTHLKQIVDHPALFLKESPRICERSGKVMRLIEMLETIIENGERALIFTQFKEMGDVLIEILQDVLKLDNIPFLHGGLTATQRDAMVEDFQSEDGPPFFILSLRAGGTGLNLTAANHVFHFDRWWNPAVEDQATDRAFRIGQEKNVQVHKFLSLGTLEEKIDIMLEEKKSLSDSIVDSSGTWVSQLDSDALREVLSLSKDAMIDDAD